MARFARHHESATTATASGMRTTPRTPGMPAIESLIDRPQRATEHRALRDGGVQHIRQPHVDGIDRLCRNFIEDVETLLRRTDELPGVRRFELDVGRRLDFGRSLGHCAERQHAPARRVHNRAGLRGALLRRHAPARRRGGDQHFPRGCTSAAQIVLRRRDRATRAGRGIAQA